MSGLAVVTLSRTPELFGALASSLAHQANVPITERVLVNNAQDHGMTVDAVEAGWAVLEPASNLSFSAANNAGVAALAAAKLLPEWVLFVNDDVTFRDPCSLERLWGWREEADVLGCILVHADGSVNHAGTCINAAGRTDHLGRHDSMGAWWAHKVAKTPCVTFACVMVRTAVWQELGGLSEAYFYGWEDSDFCLRALQAGYTVGCARDVYAVHDECGTRPRGSARDVANYKVFVGRWAQVLPGLLAGLGEDVEGVL